MIKTVNIENNKRNKSFDEDEYDHCKDIIEEKNKNNDSFKKKTNYNRKCENNYLVKDEPEKYKRNPLSPMKRNNESMNDESPKKRFRVPNFNSSVNTNNNVNAIKSFNLNTRLNKSDYLSPKKTRSSSLNLEQKKSFASTPKTDRKQNTSRIKELSEQCSAAIERNLSNNWADIIEELEEQTKELNQYTEKVSIKYKIDKEKLMKNLECDAEILRKRQKQINFGKVTSEYQRYLTEISRKKRQPYHPRTPNKFRKCSRRKFDGLIKKWRKLLHVWDENPDLLPEYKNSIENEDIDNMDDDFGGTSNITASNFSYNVDDYDIIDDNEEDEDRLEKEEAKNQINT